MTVQTRSDPGMLRLPDARLVLLFGQCLSLGITLSLMIVTAAALFMTEYGSPVLPYVYITVAILGSVGFYGFAELQRHWPLPRSSPPGPIGQRPEGPRSSSSDTPTPPAMSSPTLRCRWSASIRASTRDWSPICRP